MKSFLFILSIVALPGCDPARRINMKNTSGHDAEVIWLIKEDSIGNSPFFMNSSKEVKFTLQSNAPYNLIKLSLGQGNWAPAHFNAITEDLDSLIIRSHQGQIKLSTDELKAFLWPRRLGLDKGKILIHIK
jgi:hypothetical protein